MQTSDLGIAALIAHEGIVPGPYYDTRKVLTWGVGHTAAAGAPIPAKMARGMPANLNATLAEVMTVFAADLASYETAVRDAVTVPLLQHQFDALVSFHYNTGAIRTATLTTRLNAGDVDGAAAGLMMWTKNKELVSRRKAELALFSAATYPASNLTVWNVTAGGTRKNTVALTLTAAEALSLMRANWDEVSVATDAAATVSATEAEAVIDIPVTVRKGTQSNTVKRLQQLLTDAGFTVSRTGYFGDQTEAAVQKFQSSEGLRSDGVVGPVTWAALLT